MSLAPIREYFQARILEVDPDFSEYSDAFNSNDEVPGNIVSKAYHILSKGISPGTSDMMSTNDEVPVEVKLYFKSSGDKIEALNGAQDVANSVRLLCLKASKFRGVAGIRAITCTGLTPMPLNTNENTFYVLLNFTVQTGFSLVS